MNKQSDAQTNLDKQVAEAVSQAVMSESIKTLVKSVDSLTGQLAALQTKFVTQDEFDPIKRLVYGAVVVILVAVLGALISFVVKR